MALRFQAEDEVEILKKDRSGSALLSLFIVLTAAGLKGWCWLSGGCSTGFEGLLGWIIALCIVAVNVKVITTDLDGLNARTKEIDGKVSAIESALSSRTASTISRIEQTVNAQSEDLVRLLETLNAIEKRLDVVQRLE